MWVAEEDAEEFAMEQASDTKTSCSVFSTKRSVQSTLLSAAGECKIGVGQQQRRPPRPGDIDAVTSHGRTTRTEGSFLNILNLIHLETIAKSILKGDSFTVMTEHGSGSSVLCP